MSTKRWISGSLALIFIIVFFSGLMGDQPGAIRAWDFNTLLGTFGNAGNVAPLNTRVNNIVSTLEAHDIDISEIGGGNATITNFRGTGATASGARDGFLFVLTLIPAVMLALGTVKVVEHFGGLDVAQAGLRPLLKPLMGVPGISVIALTASLQSADAGAAATRGLVEQKHLNDRETLIMCAFQFSGGAILSNYFASGAALFPALNEAGIAIGLPLGIILVFKFIGANVMRFVILRFMYKDEQGAF